jgi:hypothetical protein
MSAWSAQTLLDDATEPRDGGFAVRLDSRPVRTPAKGAADPADHGDGRGNRRRMAGADRQDRPDHDALHPHRQFGHRQGGPV